MPDDRRSRRKPVITIARSDYERLMRLAETISTKDPATADLLVEELDRGRIVADDRIAPTVVRLGSTLRYTNETGECRTVTLVLPGEADISQGRVSVLTPVGSALVGLSEGQSIDWPARDGRSHTLTVDKVVTPAPVPASGMRSVT